MNKARKNNEGVAFLLCIFFAAVSLVILSGLTLRLQGRARHAEVFSRLEQALHAAEAGVIASQAALEAGEKGILGLMDDEVALGGFPEAFYSATAADWASDGRDNNGDGSIDNQAEAGWYAIRANGRSGLAKRTLEVVFQRQEGKLKQIAWREVAPEPAGKSLAIEASPNPPAME
jgi:hypothetical protein